MTENNSSSLLEKADLFHVSPEYLEQLQQRLQATLRDVPDFPKPGILFKDITPLFQDILLFDEVIDLLAHALQSLPPEKQIQKIVALEARGFLFGAPLATKMGLPLALLRKAGKLPAEKLSQTYDLEYGTATIEMHKDSIQANEQVLIIDDLLATGGTINASVALIEKLGGETVATAFLADIKALNGREKLPNGVEVFSILKV
ncbi:MAG: adenine phosphoribosyltransferase [Candidatus Peribacteria bacterium]|jgi:adenine phosphoribosyltransferase|nr:adenine phosphoribosyltransferase [Candidatus Peribacteria bacterium]